MTLSLKLSFQRFSRRILNSHRVPSPAQGSAVWWLHCSITGSQETYETSTSLLKMQKSLQGYSSLVRLRDMSEFLMKKEASAPVWHEEVQVVYMLVYSACL